MLDYFANGLEINTEERTNGSKTIEQNKRLKQQSKKSGIGVDIFLFEFGSPSAFVDDLERLLRVLAQFEFKFVISVLGRVGIRGFHYCMLGVANNFPTDCGVQSCVLTSSNMF